MRQLRRIYQGDLLAVEATVGLINLASGIGLCARVLFRSPDATYSALALTCASLVQLAAVLDGGLRFRYQGLLVLMAACVTQIFLSALGESLVGIIHYSVMCMICAGLAFRVSLVEIETKRHDG
jgi:hypothetical protein